MSALRRHTTNDNTRNSKPRGSFSHGLTCPPVLHPSSTLTCRARQPGSLSGGTPAGMRLPFPCAGPATGPNPPDQPAPRGSTPVFRPKLLREQQSESAARWGVVEWGEEWGGGGRRRERRGTEEKGGRREGGGEDNSWPKSGFLRFAPNGIMDRMHQDNS